MATVYDVIKKYCEENDKVIPMRTEREKIGMEVTMRFRRVLPLEKITKVWQEEIDGTFWVNNYPDYFSVIIRKLVNKYYLSLTAIPRKRKRIPVRADLLTSINSIHASTTRTR